MAGAISEGLQTVVGSAKEQVTELKDDIAHPIQFKEDAARGERLRILGYLVGERRSSGITLIKACAAEFLGTAIFIFLATGVVISGCHTQNVAAASGSSNTSLANVAPGSCFINQTSVLLNVAMGFGFALFVVIYFAASFSGGHINPAVSLAMLITRRISLLRCAIYMVLQCSGAAIGSVILKGLDPNGYKAAAGAANSINAQNGVTYGTALGYEIVLTFVLVFTIFAATDSFRALSTAPLPILAPFAIGMVVFVCHLIGVPVDGMSLNPARSFGPAVVARQFHGLWLFFIGPFIGAAVGAILYEAAFKTHKAQQDKAMKKMRSNGNAPDNSNQEDIESGIPIASNAQRAVHAGTAGIDEHDFAEDTG